MPDRAQGDQSLRWHSAPRAKATGTGDGSDGDCAFAVAKSNSRAVGNPREKLRPLNPLRSDQGTDAIVDQFISIKDMHL